eukprot:gene10242-10400_t
MDPSAESHHVKKTMHRAHDWERPTSPHGASGSSSPARGLSPALGSSPESDSSGYWTSQYAPYVPCVGGSPRTSLIREQLNRISLGRHRCCLQSAAVLTWLAGHPAAAASISNLTLDLSHHACHDFDRHQLEQLLLNLPRLVSVHLVGAIEGTDAYEPLGRLRHLHDLDLSLASVACLDGGLMALGFLPTLRVLSVSLDIPPASPSSLTDLPIGLVSLKLGGMWLDQLPQQMTELSGLTSIILERCQVEVNPLPLLLTLPSLGQLPPVVLELTALTRLELQGNVLSSHGSEVQVPNPGQEALQDVIAAQRGDADNRSKKPNTANHGRTTVSTTDFNNALDTAYTLATELLEYLEIPGPVSRWLPPLLDLPLDEASTLRFAGSPLVH